MRLRTVLLLGLSVLGLCPPAAGQDAPSLSALQEQYDELGGLRATFTQVTASDFAGDSTRIDGRVLLAGNQYRVETPGQTVVTDGETTWIYSPPDSQVVVNDADDEGSTLTPQTFLATSAARYTLQSTRAGQRDGTPHDVLSLVAADSSARFESATLWVRQSDQIVTRLRATDRNGSTLDLRLSGIEVNPPLENGAFTFDPPEGVEVVDLRADGSE